MAKYGIDWSACYKDEDARDMGLGMNRNAACHKNCMERGFLGSRGDIGNWEDCGGWKFRIRCLAPQWKGDWKDDGCKRPGVRRFAVQVECHGMDWDQSADFMLQNHIPPIGGIIHSRKLLNKFKERNNGIWVVVEVEDGGCNPGWHGDWKDDGCWGMKERRYARQVDARGGDWEASADWHLQNSVGATLMDKKVLAKWKEKPMAGPVAISMWVIVIVEDPGCIPTWGDFKEECSGKKKKWWAKIDAKGMNWTKACQIMPNKDFNGESLKASCREDVTGGYGEFVSNKPYFEQCDQTRLDNSDNRQDKTFSDDSKCFATLTGAFGPMHDNVMDPFTTDTVFMLEADNWISATAGKKTYLKGEGGGIRTDDDVGPTTVPLANKFHFRFEKVECQTDKNIVFGNLVQLKSVGSGKFIQCGGGTDLLHGTCSGVDDSGTCEHDKWQTFYIESKDGKSGRVCFGDMIYIRQKTGRQEAITPAGGGNVWSCTPGTTPNNILKIQGVNGSLYKDPTKEMEDYELNVRCKKLCTLNGADPACTFGSCSMFMNIFRMIKSYGPYAIYGIIALVVICCCSSVASKVM